MLSADCLPLLLSAEDGAVVAVAHAGWRELAAGVIGSAGVAMEVEPARLLAEDGSGANGKTILLPLPCRREPS